MKLKGLEPLTRTGKMQIYLQFRSALFRFIPLDRVIEAVLPVGRSGFDEQYTDDDQTDAQGHDESQ